MEIKMKTKVEIIERLLKEKHIDAEEAVVLLMREDQQQIIIYPQPINPYPDPFPGLRWPYGHPFYTSESTTAQA